MVAPYAGAWIETFSVERVQSKILRSLPTRERGLKPFGDNIKSRIMWSLPTRERGLKPVISPLLFMQIMVAPYAGAWIETGGSAKAAET